MKQMTRSFVIAVCMLGIFGSSALADDYMRGKWKCRVGEGADMDCMKYMCDRAKAEHKFDFEQKFYHKIGFILMNADELGLTEDQGEKIMALKFKVKKSMVLRDAEIDAVMIDIMEGLMQDDIDRAELGTLIDKKYDLKKQKTKDLLDAYISLRKTLTADQLDKLKGKWMKQMKKNMKLAMNCGTGKSDEKMGEEKESE